MNDEAMFRNMSDRELIRYADSVAGGYLIQELSERLDDYVEHREEAVVVVNKLDEAMSDVENAVEMLGSADPDVVDSALKTLDSMVDKTGALVDELIDLV